MFFLHHTLPHKILGSLMGGGTFSIYAVLMCDNMRTYVCVCVPLGIIATLLDWITFGFFKSYSRGAVGILEVTAQRRHFMFAVVRNLDADCTYLQHDDHHSFLFGPLRS